LIYRDTEATEVGPKFDVPDFGKNEVSIIIKLCFFLSMTNCIKRATLVRKYILSHYKEYSFKARY